MMATYRTFCVDTQVANACLMEVVVAKIGTNDTQLVVVATTESMNAPGLTTAAAPCESVAPVPRPRAVAPAPVASARVEAAPVVPLAMTKDPNWLL